MTFAVDGGHLDACAEGGLHRSDRNGDVDIVCDAAEEFVVADAGAGLDEELEWFAARDHAGAVAGGAAVLHFAGAAAARALDVELHAAARLLHLAHAVALGAFHGLADGACALTGGAGGLALNLEAGDVAADRRPEVDIDLVFEVRAGLRPARLTATA